MNMKIVAVGGTILGLAVGAAAGYFTAKKQLEKSYDEELAAEIEVTRRHYAVLNKGEGFSTPAEAVEALRIPASQRPAARDVVGTIIAGERYGTAGASKPFKTLNIFDGVVDDEGTDYSAENAKRSKDSPYVISREEFFENENNNSQATLTYFAEDDVLADESDMPIDDVDNMVGNGNLDRFGHRSKDPRVVYVRNEKIEIEYEICKSDGSYAKEVGGFIEHSDSRIRKFRRE